MRAFLTSLLLALVLAAAPARAADWPDRELQDRLRQAVTAGLDDLAPPAEVVAKILTLDAGGRPISFIVDCPICEPVLEAFKAYRPQGATKLTPDQIAELSQDDPLLRTAAIGRLVRGFVSASVDSAGWTAEQRKDWAARIHRAEREGQRQLRQRQAEGVEAYQLMWTCKMCDAAAGACPK